MTNEALPQQIWACMLTGTGMGYFCEYTGPGSSGEVDARAVRPPRRLGLRRFGRLPSSAFSASAGSPLVRLSTRAAGTSSGEGAGGTRRGGGRRTVSGL